MYVESIDKRDKIKDRSLHAERDAIMKCTDRSSKKNMVVLRIKKSAKLTGSLCSQNCSNFIKKVTKKINLQTIYQFYNLK